jgi:RecA/RadA recombinase
MQLALDVQIPAELGGAEAAAVYIDTEGSLMPTRVEQMAAALHRHISSLVKVRRALASVTQQ